MPKIKVTAPAHLRLIGEVDAFNAALIKLKEIGADAPGGVSMGLRIAESLLSTQLAEVSSRLQVENIKALIRAGFDIDKVKSFELFTDGQIQVEVASETETQG
jgi:hypothetical protein